MFVHCTNKAYFYDDLFVFISLHKIKIMLYSNFENICFTVLYLSVGLLQMNEIKLENAHWIFSQNYWYNNVW